MVCAPRCIVTLSYNSKLRSTRLVNPAADPMVVKELLRETCGKPASFGFGVVPCRPYCAAKGLPAFGSPCPPDTRRKPKRNSLIFFFFFLCDSSADALTEWVVRL